MITNKADTEGHISQRKEVTAMNSKPVLGSKDGDFPEWILIEVFIWLPVKLIFRSKLVCKHWLSVISDPSFVRIYVSRVSSSRQPCVIVSYNMRLDSRKHLDFLQYESVENIYSRELKFPSYLQFRPPSTQQPRLENYRIYGISNGLVLYGQIVPHTYDRIYNICNPVTGQWISLPPQTFRFKTVHRGFLTQVEDGNLKSYRVVCLHWSSQRRNTTIFSVFFSGSGEWKDLSVNSNVEVEISGRRPAFDLHGILHWVLCRKGGILAYDPDQETGGLRIIALPGDEDQEYDKPAGQEINSSLCGVSDGKLRYFVLSGLLETIRESSSVSIWTLNDYTSGDWTLHHRIRHFDILDQPIARSICAFTLPLSFDPYDSDIMYMAYTNVIVSFNIRTERLEASGNPLSIEEIIEHDRLIPYGRLPYWMDLMFLIPPWPTSISIPPSLLQIC